MSRLAGMAADIARLRADRQARWIATLVGLVLGLLAATIDPLGIVLGAALVALPARTAIRGVLRGLTFGSIVLLGLVAELALAGTLGAAIALGLPFYLAVGIGLAFGFLGGLVRGLV